MANTYQIVITDDAFSDIQQALSFLSAVSIDAAKKLNRRIKDVVLSLREYPFRFAGIDMPKSLAHDFRKAVIEHRYLLIYAIKDSTVVIERLLDARQGFASLLD